MHNLREERTLYRTILSLSRSLVAQKTELEIEEMITITMIILYNYYGIARESCRERECECEIKGEHWLDMHAIASALHNTFACSTSVTSIYEAGNICVCWTERKSSNSHHFTSYADEKFSYTLASHTRERISFGVCRLHLRFTSKQCVLHCDTEKQKNRKKCNANASRQIRMLNKAFAFPLVSCVCSFLFYVLFDYSARNQNLKVLWKFTEKAVKLFKELYKTKCYPYSIYETSGYGHFRISFVNQKLTCNIVVRNDSNDSIFKWKKYYKTWIFKDISQAKSELTMQWKVVLFCSNIAYHRLWDGLCKFSLFRNKSKCVSLTMNKQNIPFVGVVICNFSLLISLTLCDSSTRTSKKCNLLQRRIAYLRKTFLSSHSSFAVVWFALQSKPCITFSLFLFLTLSCTHTHTHIVKVSLFHSSESHYLTASLYT